MRIVIIILLLVAGWVGYRFWDYSRVDTEVAQACNTGELAPLAELSGAEDTGAFCDCLGKEMQSEIGFLRSLVPGAISDEDGQQIVMNAMTTCTAGGTETG